MEVASNNLVGKPGYALSHVAPVGLQTGESALPAPPLFARLFRRVHLLCGHAKIASQTLATRVIQSMIAKWDRI
jgi:hypothetical protein